MKYNQLKLAFLAIGIIVVYAGFMLKLPFVFRHIDKELHAAFHFSASMLICWLFGVRNMKIAVMVGVLMFAFGVFVEFSQHLSNFILQKRIHGRFDIVDIKYNLYGILVFFVVFGVLRAFKIK